MMIRRGKKIELPHPAAALAAAGILLFGAHLNQTIRSAPRTRVAAFPPQSLSGMPAGGPPAAAPLAGPPAPALLPERAGTGHGGEQRGAFPPAPVASAVPPPPREALVGPPAPARGPEWRGAPLPAFSPEVLRAMLDPRAARRARRLRRLGIVLPAEPAPMAAHPDGPPAAKPELPVARPRPGSHPLSPDLRTPGSKAVPAAPTAALPAPSGAGPAGGPGVKLTDAAPTLDTSLPPAGARPGLEHDSLVTQPAPGGSAGGAPAARTETPPVAGGTLRSDPARQGGPDTERDSAARTRASLVRPIRLQTRLDRRQSEYRVGEWVALRFLASQPAHLRVYRVDAAGHVTRVFATYGREESGHPARSFSMMLKAGEPKPGHERVVAIGSARPLTRDELLACLRGYLSEGPVESPAPPMGAAVGTQASPAAPAALPLADALQAVIDAVGQSEDLPEAAPAPLERASWSIAIGRFTSTANKVSAAGDRSSIGG